MKSQPRSSQLNLTSAVACDCRAKVLIETRNRHAAVKNCMLLVSEGGELAVQYRSKAAPYVDLNGFSSCFQSIRYILVFTSSVVPTSH